LRTSITLSNEESELMNKLKDNLNKKNIYPSKSEILRAGLWNLRKMKASELEKAVEDLLKVKQTRVL
jgi:Arc/MetJ-type ribon-helix-helix transcriptional regulator